MNLENNSQPYLLSAIRATAGPQAASKVSADPKHVLNTAKVVGTQSHLQKQLGILLTLQQQKDGLKWNWITLKWRNLEMVLLSNSVLANGDSYQGFSAACCLTCLEWYSSCLWHTLVLLASVLVCAVWIHNEKE